MLGTGRKAIVFTTCYVMQWGAKEGHTVGITTSASVTTITIKPITSPAVTFLTTHGSQRIIRTFGRYAIISITCSGCVSAGMGIRGNGRFFNIRKVLKITRP